MFSNSMSWNYLTIKPNFTDFDVNTKSLHLSFFYTNIICVLRFFKNFEIIQIPEKIMGLIRAFPHLN